MNKKKLLLFLIFVLGAAFGFAKPKEPAPPSRPTPPLPFYRPDYGAETAYPQPAFNPLLDCTANYTRGDMDRNDALTAVDLVILLNCTFLNSSGPNCLVCVGDINCDQKLSIADNVILARFIIDPPIFEIRCP